MKQGFSLEYIQTIEHKFVNDVNRFNHISIRNANSPEWMPSIHNWFLSMKWWEIWYLLLLTYCSRNRISAKAFHEDCLFHFLDEVYASRYWENSYVCVDCMGGNASNLIIVHLLRNTHPSSTFTIAFIVYPLTGWDWDSDPVSTTITLQIHLYYNIFCLFPRRQEASLQTTK